eukprot:c10270_g1_i2.p1 GENE.c10270_g1_i2~~c10270_g1_i2.p1  ORF type:complete len:375 (-),score=69.31 c10270_g1_i2:149-1273(-)
MELRSRARKHKPEQQHCSSQNLATCSRLHDVWINEIGPKLFAAEIVVLSMVNRWGRDIAHHIKVHQGHAKVKDLSCKKLTHAWPHLKLSLRLEGWTQSNQDLSTQIGCCNVSELYLRRCNVQRFDFVDPERLQSLTIDGISDAMSGLQPAACDSLVWLLTSCSSSLKTLILKTCIDCRDELMWTAIALGQLTSLTNLSICNNLLGAELFQPIATALCKLTSLTWLDVAWNELQAEGMKYLSDALIKMPHLTYLNISSNFIGPEGARYLGQALIGHMALAQSQESRITGLDLSANEIGATGAEFVAAALGKLYHMRTLSLYGNEFGAKGLEVLLPHLSPDHMPNLSLLVLFLNKLEDENKLEYHRRLPQVAELFL